MAKPEKIVSIGSFSFDVEAESLMAPNGTKVALRPQTGRVLAILAADPGHLVEKDSLMSAVWADTHVTDDSLVQCISEIRKALGPEDGALLVTVPKRGYRLNVALETVVGQRSQYSRAAPLLLLTASVVALVVTAFVVLRSPASSPMLAQSLAVMPFENASDDEGQSYYATGLSDELIVSLSQISDLRVASRSASYFVAAQTSDPRQITDELEVSLLVEGSVRRAGETLRISAALIDGESGQNLWAQTFVGVEEDIFEFQDSVLQELVRVLSVRLSPQERERLGVRGTDNVDAFDYYLRGVELADFLTAADSVGAEEAFLEALRIDPDYAAAHAQLSIVLSMQVEFSWATDISGTIARAALHAERAVSLKPELPVAHFALGRLLSRRFVGEVEGSIAAFEKAIELDPNYTDAYAFLAIALIANGQADAGLETIELAFARNPVPPYWYLMSLGLAHFQLGQYEAAEAALTELLRRNPNFPPAMRLLMATYGYLGRAEDAEWLAFEYEALVGPATIANLMNTTNMDYPPYRAAIAEGLRLAGRPE